MADEEGGGAGWGSVGVIAATFVVVVAVIGIYLMSGADVSIQRSYADLQPPPFPSPTAPAFR